MTPEEFAFEAKVHAVIDGLEAWHVPYALAGALAYGVWGVPRGTHDIDFNIFLPESEAERAIACLADVGVHPLSDDVLSVIERDGQVRLEFDGVFVDLFFAYSAFHDSCRARAHRAVWRGQSVTVLAAEDITVFKVLFNRGRDWDDVERLVRVQGNALDRDYIRGWLMEILGPGDIAVAHFEAILSEEDVRGARDDA